MSVEAIELQAGDRLRVWPGARPGRSYLATALTGVVVSEKGHFGGLPMVRVEKDSGGTDYIAPSHVEVVDAPVTVPAMPLDDDTARELSRAAKQVKSWTERRNGLIRDALAAGHGVREVARAVDLAPASVLNIQSPRKRGGT